MATYPRILSLCSGVGTLDLAIKLAIPSAQVVCYVEREVTAVRVLVSRIAEGSLADAPVWSDAQTFDGRPWRGIVDIITAGFPCQDISLAGRRVGITGRKSSVWKSIIRIIRETQPEFGFLENVAAICSARGRDMETDTGFAIQRAAGTVLRDLAQAGYDAEWICLRASDVGAPHRRDRWFCLAYRNGDRESVVRLCRESVGHAVRERTVSNINVRQVSNQRGRGVANPVGNPIWQQPRGSSRQNRTSEAESGDDMPIFPPGQNSDRWGGIIKRWPWLAPSIEPGVCGVVAGTTVVVDTARANQLRCLGNAVVPLQAAAAFVELIERSARHGG